MRTKWDNVVKVFRSRVCGYEPVCDACFSSPCRLCSHRGVSPWDAYCLVCLATRETFPCASGPGSKQELALKTPREQLLWDQHWIISVKSTIQEHLNVLTLGSCQETWGPTPFILRNTWAETNQNEVKGYCVNPTIDWTVARVRSLAFSKHSLSLFL